MAKLSVKTYPVRFGENEKNLRETWGMSEQEMGEVAGVRESTVIAWEKEALQPTVDAAARIGTYFDIHPAVLLWGDTVLTDSTPVIRMGLLSESDYKDMLAFRDNTRGTLVLTENEMDVVRAFRHLNPGGRIFLRRLLNQQLRQEQRIREQL